MKKKTQNEIALRLGVTHSAVSQWFNGKTEPKLKNVFVLKDEFQIPLNAWRDIKSYLQDNNTKS